MTKCLPLTKIILFVFLLLVAFVEANAGKLLSRDSVYVAYNVEIDIRKAYVSGVCFIEGIGGECKGMIVNEFGVTLLSFFYSSLKDRVKIVGLVKKMDKCYLKRILRNDLNAIMKLLEYDRECVYENEKFKLTYKFVPQNITDDSAR